MARASQTKLQVLTANRLIGGDVVYAGPDGWTEAFSKAEIFQAQDAASGRLEAAESDIRSGLIVEPYLFDVEETPEGVRPVSVRETIRARGPSVRPDLGKQADRAPE